MARKGASKNVVNAPPPFSPLLPFLCQARCRALLTDMRSIYAQCEEMTRQGSLLSIAARDMEACERRDRGEIVVGDATGEDSDGAEWGREDEADEETARRRKAGVRVLGFSRTKGRRVARAYTWLWFWFQLAPCTFRFHVVLFVFYFCCVVSSFVKV